jgi:protein involved in sex pheromone biosynthesis
MKKLGIAAVLGLLFLSSCADKKENREEFKDDHNKEYMRNSLGDTASARSESSASDSMAMKRDTAAAK